MDMRESCFVSDMVTTPCESDPARSGPVVRLRTDGGQFAGLDADNVGIDPLAESKLLHLGGNIDAEIFGRRHFVECPRDAIGGRSAEDLQTVDN